MPLPPPDRTGFTTTTPVPLRWVSYGAPVGTPPRLLVLHGGPGASHEYLLPQMLRLTEGGGGREVVLYDQRGGGASRHDDDREVITWQLQVGDVARVARELELVPPVIIGYSWGGLLAMLYAIEAAEGRIAPAPAALVLIDPAPVTRAWRQEFETALNARQSSPEVQALRTELTQSGLRERDSAAYRQRAFEISVAGYFADPRAARDLTPFRVTGRVQQSIWQSLGEYDLRPALARLRGIPSLVVHGRQDPIPLESSKAVATALDATFVVIEGSGHVPYVERPDELFTAVEAFLTSAPVAS